jgi:hypothetical protein
MDLFNKKDDTIELLFITIGPSIVVASLLINFINTFILRAQDLISSRLLLINSILASIILGISLFIPISQCKTVCKVSSNNLIILIYEYYFCLCFGSLFTYINLGLSILVSIYRALSIHIVKSKLNFNFRLHILLIILICLVIIFPWSIHKRIVLEPHWIPSVNESHKYMIRVTTIGSNKFFRAYLALAPLFSVVVMIAKIVLDSFTLFYLKKSFKRRRKLGRLSRYEADNILRLNKNLDKENTENIETNDKIIKNLLTEQKETKPMLTISCLLICSVSENIVNVIAFYLFYNYTENMDDFKMTTFISYIFFSLNYLLNFFVKYYFDGPFREKFNRLVMCILCIIKSK